MSKTPNKRTELAKLITVLAEAFRSETSDPMFAAYEIGLDDLDISTVKRAVTAAIHTCKFMPTVVELRELSGVVRTEDRAVIAFGVLDKAVLGHGSYRTVHFDDPFLNATVHDLGGWEKVCATPEKEWFSFFRQRFIQTYGALARRGVISHEQSRPLVGYFDRVNGIGGYKPQAVQTIACGLPETKVRIAGPTIGIPDMPKLDFRPPQDGEEAP